MPQILPIPDLKIALSASYSRETLLRSKTLRLDNINAFSAINRRGLQYACVECRILLYKTICGEKVFVQLPGKESSVNNRNPMPNDFRPKLQLANDYMMQDASFGFIWDILDEIGKRHREYLSMVASLFYRMGYMYDYIFKRENYERFSLVFPPYSAEESCGVEHPVDLGWHCIEFSDDIWYSLNNYVGDIRVSDEHSISFEAFIKFVDLLLQNEDCKYYYRNVTQGHNPEYNLRSGRTSTCDANLLILYYLEGHCGISKILDSFQKARGVPPFRKTDYHIVTDEIVVQE